MPGVSSYISIPSVNANRVGSPIKRHRCLKKKKKKKRPNSMLSTRNSLQFKDTQRLKVRG